MYRIVKASTFAQDAIDEVCRKEGHSRSLPTSTTARNSHSVPCGKCDRPVNDEGIQCNEICSCWFQFPEEDISALKQSAEVWKCYRCLTIATAISDLLTTTKILSERLQLMEVQNKTLMERLDFLESIDNITTSAAPTSPLTLIKDNMIGDPQAPSPSPTNRKDHESPQRTESMPNTDRRCSLHSHGVTRDNRASAGDDSRETMFIRRIRVNLQIEAMQQIINKQCVIPAKELKLTQSLPTGEFSDKWKNVQCQGSKSTLERLACACQ